MKKSKLPKKRALRPSKKAVILDVALLILASVLYFTLLRNNSSNPVTGTTSDGQKVNLSPPTATEKQASNDAKNAITQQQQKSNVSSDSNQSSSAAMVITEPSSANPSSTSVKGYVTGVFEDGGTCTATAQQGSQSYSQTSSGFANVSYTQCVPIKWNTPLPSGTWTITLSYKSATTSASQSVTINVIK